jgi:OFA family oxalate/formate antiporter-like MFS transporter
MFFILAAAYFVMMFLGHLLLKKPEGWHEPQGKEAKPSIMQVLKTRPISNYVGIWLMFFLNITCGLALISQEKMIVKCLGLAGAVGIISTVSAIFNAGGRLGFSAWADKMKDRNTVYKMIFIAFILCFQEHIPKVLMLLLFATGQSSLILEIQNSMKNSSWSIRMIFSSIYLIWKK